MEEVCRQLYHANNLPVKALAPAFEPFFKAWLNGRRDWRRYIERVTALQDEVGDLNNRVNQLERQNVHREERRRLLSKAVGCIPFVKRLFRHD